MTQSLFRLKMQIFFCLKFKIIIHENVKFPGIVLGRRVKKFAVIIKNLLSM